MTKTKTAIRVSTISLLAISLLSVGFVNTQFAAATSATLTNNVFGSVDDTSDTRTVTFTTTEIPAGETITDVNIAVDFEKDGDDDCSNPDSEESWSDEISMSLQSPDGTVVNLVFDFESIPGVTYNNIANSDRVVVTFDDDGSFGVGTTNGGIPETGTFQPEEPLSAFNDESPQGIWIFTYGDNSQQDLLCFNQFDLTIEAELTEIEIDIDIKPGSDQNSINPNSKGLIPVAILGTADFDVNTVDVTTLGFEGGILKHDLTDPVVRAEHTEDVNGDGIDDLVTHWVTQSTNIICGYTHATLTGDTTDGTPLVGGTDSVKTPGKDC